ncbi:hypothetical protein D3C87_849000 [compost metagenome]
MADPKYHKYEYTDEELTAIHKAMDYYSLMRGDLDIDGRSVFNQFSDQGIKMDHQLGIDLYDRFFDGSNFIAYNDLVVFLEARGLSDFKPWIGPLPQITNESPEMIQFLKDNNSVIFNNSIYGRDELVEVSEGNFVLKEDYVPGMSDGSGEKGPGELVGDADVSQQAENTVAADDAVDAVDIVDHRLSSPPAIDAESIALDFDEHHAGAIHDIPADEVVVESKSKYEYMKDPLTGFMIMPTEEELANEPDPTLKQGDSPIVGSPIGEQELQGNESSANPSGLNIDNNSDEPEKPSVEHVADKDAQSKRNAKFTDTQNPDLSHEAVMPDGRSFHNPVADRGMQQAAMQQPKSPPVRMGVMGMMLNRFFENRQSRLAEQQEERRVAKEQHMVFNNAASNRQRMLDNGKEELFDAMRNLAKGVDSNGEPLTSDGANAAVSNVKDLIRDYKHRIDESTELLRSPHLTPDNASALNDKINEAAEVEAEFDKLKAQNPGNQHLDDLAETVKSFIDALRKIIEKLFGNSKENQASGPSI